MLDLIFLFWFLTCVNFLYRRLSDTSTAPCRRRSYYILAWRILTSVSSTPWVSEYVIHVQVVWHSKQIKAPNFILAVLCYSPALNDVILCHVQSLSCLYMSSSHIFSGCLHSCRVQSIQFLTWYILSCVSVVHFPVGSLDSRRCCTWIIERNLEVRQSKEGQGSYCEVTM